MNHCYFQCLSLGSLNSLVLFLRVRPEPTWVDHLSQATLWGWVNNIVGCRVVPETKTLGYFPLTKRKSFKTFPPDHFNRQETPRCCHHCGLCHWALPLHPNHHGSPGWDVSGIIGHLRAYYTITNTFRLLIYTSRNSFYLSNLERLHSKTFETPCLTFWKCLCFPLIKIEPVSIKPKPSCALACSSSLLYILFY